VLFFWIRVRCGGGGRGAHHGPAAGGFAGGGHAEGPEDTPPGGAAGARTRFAGLYVDRGGGAIRMRSHLPSVARCPCLTCRLWARAVAAAARSNWPPRNCWSCCHPRYGSRYEQSCISRRACGHRGPAECRQIDLGECLGGAKVSIVTAKPQTTRHRILGVVNRPRLNWCWSIRRVCMNRRVA